MSQQRIHAPMTATVVEVAVAPGARVHAGQILLILEAMKMEHELRAERDAQVQAVLTHAGEMVSEGDLLLQQPSDKGKEDADVDEMNQGDVQQDDHGAGDEEEQGENGEGEEMRTGELTLTRRLVRPS